MWEHLLIFSISLVANGLSALAGGGSGLLQFPALLFLGLSFSSALTTHKIATVALGVGATLKHMRSSTLNWKFALLVLGSGLPGVILGSYLILLAPDRWALLTLGLLTASLGIYSASRKELGQKSQPRHQEGKGRLIGAAVLFLLGILNGSLSSGTGLFVTLWLIHWFGLDYQKAVAYTLVLVGLFWNGAGAWALAINAPVQWAWIPALITGALIGGYAGTAFALKKGNPLIKRMFEVMTILVGISLIIKSL